MWYVYILRCADQGWYTGCTSDLRKRLKKHQEGAVFATKKRTPVLLFSYIALQDRITAFRLEKYLKTGSGRAFFSKHFLTKNTS